MYRELEFHPDVDFIMKQANANSELQIQQIRDFMKMGIDLLIVSPNESEPLTMVIEEVYDSGIPIILIDRKTESEKYTAYIGADNYEIGLTAAEYIAHKFKRQGKIIEIHFSFGISASIERNKGFNDKVKMYENMAVVARVNGEDTSVIENKLSQTIEKHPNANIIFGHTDLLAEKSHKILKKKNLTDNYFFVGIDGIPGTGRGIEAVEEGVLDASLLYPTGGAKAISLAMSILKNEPFDKKNLLETTVIDSSNARILNLQFKKVSSLQKRIDKQKSLIEAQKIIFRNQRTFIFILVSSLLLALVLGALLWKSMRIKQRINESLEAKNKEVLEKQQQLVCLSEEIRQVTQTKLQFFTNISHEFRTPLTLILGAVEWNSTADYFKNPELKQDLGIIQKNALRLLRLVNQLMDFRKIDQNKMLAQVSENDLIEFTKDIMAVFERSAEKREIDFHLFSRETNLRVWFDKNMIDKVLFNLLSNSFKFTPNKGHIHLSIEKDTSDSMNSFAKITVTDTGIGMSKEQVEHVFERFYQGGKYGIKGTGLGLSFSKELVNLHKGSIDVWSEQEKGTRFEIRLPLGKQHFKTSQIRFEEKETSTYQDYELYLENEEEAHNETAKNNVTKEYNLLLIEDNKDLRTFLRNKLQGEYQILETDNGKSAWNIATEEVPDLIICDVMIPEQDGLSLSKRLKSDLRTSHIPIILLTANSTEEQKLEGVKTGVDVYMTKPFHLSFLLETIKTLLFNRRILKERYQVEVQDAFEVEPTAFKDTGNDLDNTFLQEFMNFVAKNYNRQDFGMPDFEKVFHLSRAQIYRKVKALTGQSVSEYIKKVRMERAKQMIGEGKLTISEIAYEVGYSSPGYFATVFKGEFGVSPSKFEVKKP